MSEAHDFFVQKNQHLSWLSQKTFLVPGEMINIKSLGGPLQTSRSKFMITIEG